MSYYSKHTETPSSFSHHEWRTTNQYHAVHPNFETTSALGTRVKRGGEVSGFTNNFSVTRHHMVSHEGPMISRSLAVKKQPKAMHEAHEHVRDIPRFNQADLLGTGYMKAPGVTGKDNGFGRNNKGYPDSSVRLNQDRLVHPAILEKVKKTNPTEAENSGTGPAKFSTSTAQTYIHPYEQPDTNPTEARILNPDSNGFTTNIPPSIRPVTPREDYDPIPPPMVHQKPRYKFETQTKGSMSHSLHTWARPSDPDPNSVTLQVEPSPAKPHYHGRSRVPQVLNELGPFSTPYMHPSTAKDVRTKDPIEYNFLTNPKHVGSTTSNWAAPKERRVDKAIGFSHTFGGDSKSAGFEGNFSHQPYHLARPTDHTGTTTAYQFAEKNIGHSLTNMPDRKFQSEGKLSGYTRSIFKSTSGPCKGDTFTQAGNVHRSLEAMTKKAHPYMFEERPCTERF
eukprot:CAMPEP_0197848294 /NCGR_PEP_ID=MMETSP1438-20131217/8147_1 /TAXON_ID=1461541 /ORGANISM="Pterosperma sp., Strain CCMP1384" /LENGTH=449 /DNA_ID=CAMNT_0043460455 /DNA_START=125 /DNA_END=1474 /DNA_ORIENTATION=+